jgi:hypothetical protein
LFERVDQLTKEVLLIKEHHYSPKTWGNNKILSRSNK